MRGDFLGTCVYFAARGILDNFEISLAVLLPNTTTSRAITYTNTNAFFFLSSFFKSSGSVDLEKCARAIQVNDKM